MKRLLFIYNPAAGKGLTRQRLASVVERFSAAGWLTTVCPTHGKGDATRIAQELGSEFDRVVCAGGDGTLSETVAGLMALPHPPQLGYVPAGSTNDCARNLHLPTGMERAAAVAAGDLLRPLDVGMLNKTPFIYVAAFGAFTDVAYDTPQELKKAFGHLAYIMAGIGQLASLTPYHLRVEHDNVVIEDDFLYGMVCNTYSVAGMRTSLTARQVVLDDGLFEVVLVRKNITLSDLGNVLQSILRGEAAETAALVSFQAERVTISCSRPIPWTLDGEYGGTHAVSHLENRTRAITVVHGK